MVVAARESVTPLGIFAVPQIQATSPCASVTGCRYNTKPLIFGFARGPSYVIAILPSRSTVIRPAYFPAAALGIEIVVALPAAETPSGKAPVLS